WTCAESSGGSTHRDASTVLPCSSSAARHSSSCSLALRKPEVTRSSTPSRSAALIARSTARSSAGSSTSASGTESATHGARPEKWKAAASETSARIGAIASRSRRVPRERSSGLEVLAAGRSRGLERFEASRGVGREGGIEGGIDGGTGRECPGRGDEGRAGTWGSSRSAERDPAEDLDRGLRDDGEEEEQPAEQREGHGADDEIAHEHGVLGIVVIGVGGHASTVLRAT